ncbi:lipopolysaccharide biosynthesis protein [Kitasatospora misakiensis]|uniref:Lipopolysaccharide biosynthesis protein n=1 Tax=Kitasatospora misakiensis TaxID=67330 RepID=A0ABW0X9B5_9ACTN
MSARASAAADSAGTCSCPVPLPCECSYRDLVRARLRATRVGEPLLRNGHVLTLSSFVTAVFGMVFWVGATAWYDAETVGRWTAALAAASLLSGIGQLNLGDALMRFLPTAGRRTRRLVLSSYTATVAASTLVAGAFLALIPLIAPSLGFLRSPVVALSFVAATAGYSLFVLQDGALTGLRRPSWVLLENALFAVAKAGLLAGCAFLALETGILLSWSGALIISLVVTNVYLFRHAVPSHQRAAPVGTPQSRFARYAVADYIGSLCRLTAYSVVPLLVLAQLGAEQNAYVALPWAVSYTFYLVALNMGSSLLVEAARAPERLAEHGRRVLRHAGRLLAATGLATVFAAPRLLSLFGAQYAEHGTTVLRLLVLSALPNLVVDVAVDVARARRRMGWVVALQGTLCVLVLVLAVALIPSLGIDGVGWAWLVAQSALALPLLLLLRYWLPRADPGTRTRARARTRAGTRADSRTRTRTIGSPR